VANQTEALVRGFYEVSMSLKLFSSSMTIGKNKLECFYLERFFSYGLLFEVKAGVGNLKMLSRSGLNRKFLAFLEQKLSCPNTLAYFLHCQ